MAKNYDLYISYNWSQFNQVKIICDLLKESEFNIWFDESETVNNDLNEFEKNIHALQTSLVFIYFPSREYNKCTKNKIEYTTAFEQNMKMICLDLNTTNGNTTNGTSNTTQFKINNSMIKNYSKSNELNLIINFIKMECNLSYYSFGHLIRKNNSDIDWFKTYFSFKRRESRASSKGSLFYAYFNSNNNNNNNNRPLSRNKSMYITNKRQI
jgi:hypothetical protein